MLSVIIQGPVNNNYIQEFIKLERLLSSIVVEMIWCATAIPSDIHMPNDTSLQLFSVPDCGAIPVKTPPHFTNTNRMFLTTRSAFAKIHPESNYVLKLRSDLKISDEKLFFDFLNQLTSKPAGVLVCAAQANHDWDLPFNLADWCFGGKTQAVKLQVERLTEISHELGRCSVKTLNDFLFGYIKNGYSPKYTTEQIFGAMMFDVEMSKINTYASSKLWSHIKNKKLANVTLQDAGLSSLKHHVITKRQRITYPILLNVMITFAKNLIRSIF